MIHKNEMTSCSVKGIIIDEQTGTSQVLLQSEDGTSLPIPTEPFETGAILIEIQGASPPKPLTHDLLALVMEELNIKKGEIEIYRCRGCQYDARLSYRRRFRRITREVRASDGIAVALRLGLPIRASVEMFSEGKTSLIDENSFAAGREVIFLPAEAASPIDRNEELTDNFIT
ncbi:MAG: bifunctional nuclease family protein [Spirochaetales bacterium]|nr:bifunctional nuclease family protein [Spirochaetales bacterium]MCF7939265.1 bifunctional nuclease family protein [Spirochaetales bacterium]